MKNLFYVPLFLLATVTASNAAVVAVVDTGVDVDHPDLKNQIVENSGWNFVNNSPDQFDESYRDLLTYDMQMYFKYDYVNRNLSLSDPMWDKDLMNWYLEVFEGNPAEITASAMPYAIYSHGTHVAGIIARAKELDIVPVKLMASYEAEASSPEILTSEETIPASLESKLDEQLNIWAHQELKDMDPIFNYLSETETRVINASFGVTWKTAENQIKTIAPKLNWDELQRVTGIYLNKLLDGGREAFKNSSNFLYVTSAGNDGSNIDNKLEFPASLQRDNFITVGAAYLDGRTPMFTNRGANTVDVMADDFGTLSSIPGGHAYLYGTSQAVPQVTRIAGRIFDIAPNLNVFQVKKIILETVDKTPLLKNKCITSGIVNEERAVSVARSIIAGESIDEAIARSLKDIPSRIKQVTVPIF